MSIKKTVPLLLIGPLIFVLYLYFFVDWERIMHHLRSVNPVYYSLAFLATVLSVFFYSLAWYFFLLLLSVKPSLRSTFQFVWVGMFVDLLIPAEAVSGDISKTYLMSKNSGGKTGEVVASIVGHRLLNMAITLVTLIASSTIFVLSPGPRDPRALSLLTVAITGTAVSLSFMWLISVREEAAWKIVDLVLRLVAWASRGRWSLDTLRHRGQRTLRAFRRGIDVLGRRPRALLLPIVFSLTSWAFHLSVSFLVFLSLGQPISASALVIVLSMSDAIQTFPLGVPGEVGVTEFAMTWLYSVFSAVTLEVGAAATVLIRVVTMWFRLLVGCIVAHWVGVKALMGSSQKPLNR